MNEKGRVLLIGAAGRMGRALIQQLDKSPSLSLEKAIVGNQSKWLQQDSGRYAQLEDNDIVFEATLPPTLSSIPDILIDFSTSERPETWLQWAVDKGLAYLNGSTQLKPSFIKDMQQASALIPVMYESNFSLGIALLKSFFKQHQQALEKHFQAHILEKHHEHKKDSPSGTALSLAQLFSFPPPIESLRQGEEIGYHQLILENPLEKLLLCHQAKDRQVFASGALQAADFLLKRKKEGKSGLYSLQDLICEKGGL